MKCSVQEFVEALTEELRRATPQVREQFRRCWIEQSDRTALRLIGADVRWLKEIKIYPSGD